MPVILKQTPIGKRVFAISQEDADLMVSEGSAVQDKAHTAIYEEVTPEERSQGYLTRNLVPLDVTPKKRGRPPKARVDEPEVNHPVEE